MKDLNNILKKLSYGHYVVTALKPAEELKTRDKDYLAAGTVNWLTQVSFEPAMIAVAIGQQSQLNETIDYSEHFTIHLLGPEQKEWIEGFAGKSTVANGKINGVAFEKRDHALILKNCLGYITCLVAETTNTGDHTLHIGEVVAAELFDTETTPLTTKDQAIKYTKSKVS